MIGTQPTGAIEGVIIIAAPYDDLIVTAGGKPAQLAVVLEDGTVVASGSQVAQELRALAVNCYRNFLRGQGWVRVFSKALPCLPAPPAHASAIISAVSHEGPTVMVDGQSAQFAVIAEDGVMFAAGKIVAREAEAVAINSYRHYLMEIGVLRVVNKPPVLEEWTAAGPLSEQLPQKSTGAPKPRPKREHVSNTNRNSSSV